MNGGIILRKDERISVLVTDKLTLLSVSVLALSISFAACVWGSAKVFEHPQVPQRFLLPPITSEAKVFKVDTKNGRTWLCSERSCVMIPNSN
jgi:hypothetical protein